MVYIIFSMVEGDVVPFINVGGSNSWSVWHHHLGHSSNIALHILKIDLNFNSRNGVEICEVCRKSKRTRESFPLSDHKSEENFQFMYCDVWGLSRLTSRFGFKYYFDFC